MIEPTTSEIALAIAGTDYNCYLFEGLKNRRHSDLHITSSKFDDPQCLELVADCDHVIAIHGCVGDDVEFVEVGGRDTRLRDEVCIKLAAAGFEAKSATKFVGTHPDNICNRNRTRAGVQLEITRMLRDAGTRRYATHDTLRRGCAGRPASAEQERLKLKALRQAIAKGDADFAAGRAKTYKTGELANELREAIPRREK